MNRTKEEIFHFDICAGTKKLEMKSLFVIKKEEEKGRERELGVFMVLSRKFKLFRIIIS